jgi:hypothetical protein
MKLSYLTNWPRYGAPPLPSRLIAADLANAAVSAPQAHPMLVLVEAELCLKFYSQSD